MVITLLQLMVNEFMAPGVTMTEKNNSQKSYAETVAAKANEAEEMISSVSSKLISVLQPDVYVQFLDMIERFHWYSYMNNLLVLFQFPDAQYLAGYDVWKRTALNEYNDPTRRILKASSVGHGIKLIAPFTVVTSSTRSLISVSVPVYDINQLNDIPRPENDFLDLSKCNYVDIINAINFVAPYRTVYASSEDKNLSYNIKGYCNHSQQQFVVDSRLSVRGLLSVLLHEFAVAALFLASYKNEVLHGLVVESVYYILMKHFRLEVEDITFSFIGRYKDVENRDIAEAFYFIQTVAHSIIEKIEEHLEYIIELMPAYEDFSYQTNFFDEVEFRQGSVVE